MLCTITSRVMMRRRDGASGPLFSGADPEERIPARHPLREIRQVANDAPAGLGAASEALRAGFGRPPIAPERLIRASLPQLLFPVRSGRRQMERFHIGDPTVRVDRACQDLL